MSAFLEGLLNGSDGTGDIGPRADTVHAFFRIVEKFLPEALMMENVHGFRLRHAKCFADNRTETRGD